MRTPDLIPVSSSPHAGALRRRKEGFDMSASRGLGIEKGAAAGLIGGVVSGVLLQLTHMITPAGVPASAMRLVADAVHVAELPAAWIAYLIYAALIGAGFGALLARQHVGEGSGIVWGVLYGGF